MRDSQGLCVISIPKSGTMFLSRYLERVTACPVIFGRERRTATELAQDLDAGWHPAIRDAADPQHADIALMCRRFALMLNRNRQALEGRNRKLILSDHGHTNFLQFLINPKFAQICDPRELVRWSRDRGMTPVFLYRAIPEIANSLAHFLAAGKSFLLTLRTRADAARIVSELHAPVLARQTAAWLEVAAEQKVLALSYSELVADPAHWIREVARRANMLVDPGRLHEDAAAYRSWTYRSKPGKSRESWRSSFTPVQQAALEALCPIRKGAL